jgi:hypothetical protein
MRDHESHDASCYVSVCRTELERLRAVEAELDREREIRQSMAMGSVEQRKRAMKAEEERDAAVRSLEILASYRRGANQAEDMRRMARTTLDSLSAADTEPGDERADGNYRSNWPR